MEFEDGTVLVEVIVEEFVKERVVVVLLDVLCVDVVVLSVVVLEADDVGEDVAEVVRLAGYVDDEILVEFPSCNPLTLPAA